MAKKKNFDDEYNQLFSKPARRKLFNGNTFLGRIINRQPGDRRIKTSWVIIVFLFAIILYFGRFYFYGWMQGSNDKSQDVLPLKVADVRQNGAIDLSKPLVATLDNHVFKFNRGYQLAILGDSEIELNSKELSVLPTKDEFVYDKNVASITFNKNEVGEVDGELSISGNLIKSESDYVDNSKTDFSKAYPQKDIDGIKQGYIINYSDDKGSIFTTIKQYYIFSDGTGITIIIDSNDEKEINDQTSLKDIKDKYSKDFNFLAKHFKLEKQT